MLRLRVRIAAATVLLAAVLSTSACAGPNPAPATPSPSPTLASDEEAFRAAEATYRAYVDALNAVDLADPTTFEPVFALTTGTFLETTEATFANMHEQRWSVSGDTRVIDLDRIAIADLALQLAICIDVEDVLVIDATGLPVASADRSSFQDMVVSFAATRGVWLISDVQPQQSGAPCSS